MCVFLVGIDALLYISCGRWWLNNSLAVGDIFWFIKRERERERERKETHKGIKGTASRRGHYNCTDGNLS